MTGWPAILPVFHRQLCSCFVWGLRENQKHNHFGMNILPPQGIWLSRIARICFAITGISALLVLLTWLGGFWEISENLPMAPSAAILMLGLASATFMRHSWPDLTGVNGFVRAVGVGVLLTSLFTLGKIFFGLLSPRTQSDGASSPRNSRRCNKNHRRNALN